MAVKLALGILIFSILHVVRATDATDEASQERALNLQKRRLTLQNTGNDLLMLQFHGNLCQSTDAERTHPWSLERSDVSVQLLRTSESENVALRLKYKRNKAVGLCETQKNLQCCRKYLLQPVANFTCVLFDAHSGYQYSLVFG